MDEGRASSHESDTLKFEGDSERRTTSGRDGQTTIDGDDSWWAYFADA